MYENVSQIPIFYSKEKPSNLRKTRVVHKHVLVLEYVCMICTHATNLTHNSNFLVRTSFVSILVKNNTAIFTL